MMESCWAPMMAAFSVLLDQCDDKAATSQCLKGLRFSVHVTSVMCMQTQRDAFLTSIAKFTSLHSAADMKQKNVDAMKVRGHTKHICFSNLKVSDNLLLSSLFLVRCIKAYLSP